MDGVYVAYSDQVLSDSDFSLVIEAMHREEKWIPLLWTIREAARATTGAGLEPYEDRVARGRIPNGIHSKTVEVFFPQPRQLIFVVNGIADALTGPGTFEARRYVERNFHPDAVKVGGGIVVGGTGDDHESAQKVVDDFCSAFELHLKKSVDGRRARHLRFNWNTATGQSSRGQNLSRLREDESGIRFATPSEIDDATRKSVMIMTNPTVRTILREVGESGFVRHADLLSRRGRRQQEFDVAMEEIKGSGLVETEYLLQCRKTSAQLVRVGDISELTAAATASFRCANCNRAFSEELTSEGYGLNETGKLLTRGSHWMTMWVTEQLLEMGVSLSNILWNVEDAGEEVDIVIEHLERIWIFELKDREFGAGDAYPFNYRKVRYKAHEAVVVTTEKVAPDARRVFSDTPASRDPILIEGLNEFRRVLEQSFKITSSRAVRNILLLPSSTVGIDFRKWYDSMLAK